MKKYLFFLLLIISNSISAQFLKPPYGISILKSKLHYKEFRQYFNELDLDGDGKPELVTCDKSPELIDGFHFFDSKLNLIDAVNAKRVHDHFSFETTIVKSANGDKFIVPYYAKNECQLWLVGMKDKNIYIDVLYSLPHRGGALDYDIHYLIIPNKYLIVSINTLYPMKHEYRRIFAFDLNNFKLQWEIRTADYISGLFYSKVKPNHFFYTTMAYWNGLTFSNNTFYTQSAIDYKYSIDTAFTKKYYPVPDSTASDYSTDSKSYIVECSLDGHYVKRKQVGNHFEHLLENNTLVNDSTVLIKYLSRTKSRLRLLEYKILSEKLDTLLSLNAKLHTLMFVNHNVYVVTKDSVKTYKFSSDKLTFMKKEYVPNNYRSFFQKVNSHYFFISDNVVVTDTTFNIIAQSSNIINYNFVGFSKALNSYYFRSNENNFTEFFTLKKLSLLDRFSGNTFKYLFGSSAILIFVLLILWGMTMSKSRQKVHEQNLMLVEKQKELEGTTAKLIHTEKLALLGTVAASFAHQLNSPLGAIINSAERLGSKVKDENLDLIIRSAEYSKSMVSKFLFASRPDSETENICINFNDIWESWNSIFKSEFVNHGIEIITDIKPTSARIKTKRSEIFEILSNLLFNARDAILESEKDEKQISVSVAEKEDKIIITITDTGTGLTEEQIEKIFNPFYTSKPVGMGTGLGLWITKKLVEKAKGKITVTTNKKGATFIVELPTC
jgi:signal transduction histidine kinase